MFQEKITALFSKTLYKKLFQTLGRNFESFLEIISHRFFEVFGNSVNLELACLAKPP